MATKLELKPGRRIHLVGIGGAGLSAIARVLLERGCVVSGSDLIGNAQTESLAAAGARIFTGHAADHVTSAELLLATSAVKDDHVELEAARRLGVSVFRRREFLPALTRGADTLAVAGTHGKTTTTAMITTVLRRAGKDPNFIVGGAMGNGGKNAGSGSGDFVIEADEYDNMFLGLNPTIAVVTNVEHDHPDFFASREAQQRAFAQFAARLPAAGTLVACVDDAGARELYQSRRKRNLPAISYGAKSKADWSLEDPRFDESESRASVIRRNEIKGELRLQIPGAHNLLNALAALIVAESRGVALEQSLEILREFKNASRRFQIRGLRDDIIIVDDYAHHPTEIRVNLRAARDRYPGRQIWAIWQPHTYSRVRAFLPDFLRAFEAADRVLITPIYAAREKPVEGINSQMLAESMRPFADASFAPSFKDAAATLSAEAKAPALALICSAGDANQVADLFLNPDA